MCLLHHVHAYLPAPTQSPHLNHLPLFQVCATLGHKVLTWRRLPRNNSSLGESALKTEPVMEQAFITRKPSDDVDFEKQLYVLRKTFESECKQKGWGHNDCYVSSLSSRTIVYKGQLTPEQVPTYFVDLQQEDFASYMALVHSRFSTNTFPSWTRAQPMRMMAHNGEINTLRGNRNWMKARYGVMKCEALGVTPDRLKKVLGGVGVGQREVHVRDDGGNGVCCIVYYGNLYTCMCTCACMSTQTCTYTPIMCRNTLVHKHHTSHKPQTPHR